MSSNDDQKGKASVLLLFIIGAMLYSVGLPALAFIAVLIGAALLFAS